MTQMQSVCSTTAADIEEKRTKKCVENDFSKCAGH